MVTYKSNLFGSLFHAISLLHVFKQLYYLRNVRSLSVLHLMNLLDTITFDAF